MKQSQLRNLLRNGGVTFSTLSKNKRGNWVIRRPFFYRMGMSEDKLVEQLRSALPSVVIIDKGERWVPFRGGQSVARGSHFWVEFKEAE